MGRYLAILKWKYSICLLVGLFVNLHNYKALVHTQPSIIILLCIFLDLLIGRQRRQLIYILCIMFAFSLWAPGLPYKTPSLQSDCYHNGPALTVYTAIR